MTNKVMLEVYLSTIKTVSENKMNKSPWIKINKGDRRPTDRVLVSYDYEDPLDGQKKWRVTVAYWNAKRQFWVADHGKLIGGVTHWMPLDKELWEYD